MMNIIILGLIPFLFWSLKQFKYLWVTGNIKGPKLSHAYLLIVFNRQRWPTKNKGAARKYGIEEASPARLILIELHRWGGIWVRTCSLSKVRQEMAFWGRESTSRELRQCVVHAWEDRWLDTDWREGQSLWSLQMGPSPVTLLSSPFMKFPSA